MRKVDRLNIISLDKILQRGVHIEKASEFRESIFEEVFRNSIYAVEKIVTENREKEDQKYLKKHSEEIEIPNVISFIGRRGTGKTSALLSFQNALAEYGSQNIYGRENGIIFNNKVGMENVRFFTLDFIDASILDESEDVFILVLARMYNNLQDINQVKQCKNSVYYDLMKRLGEIYSDFLNLKEEKQYRNDIYSPIEHLEHIASSQNIRRQFAKLVESYLSYIGNCENTPCHESYLVIVIDDMDMANYNVEKRYGKDKKRCNSKSYEISNSIHKYLSIPKIIVLTAYNHINLITQNWSFFIEKEQLELEQEIGEQRRASAELASQFMDKVFPLDYRVYMPSWRKKDFQKERFQINVKTSCADEKNIFYQYSYLQGKDVLSIKEFILVLYAAKIGIYFDFSGEKVHFLEPDSLRKLVSIIKLFEYPGYVLEKVVQKDKKEKYRNIIIKRIKNDAYFRFAQENLFIPEERGFFDELMSLRIDKRSEEIVRRYCEYFTKLGKEKKKMEKETGPVVPYAVMKEFYLYDELDQSAQIRKKFDNRNVTYSFAELVHTLFHMFQGNNWASRELASCILYSYSICLSEIYDDYRKWICDIDNNKLKYLFRNKHFDERRGNESDTLKKLNDDYETLKGVIGKSICGHWTEYFFPEVFSTVIPKGRRQSTVIIGCVDVKSVNFRVMGMKGKEKNIVKQIIVYAMLYADVLDRNHLLLDVRSGDSNQYSVQILVPYKHELEMTSYINYAFLYRDFLSKMEKLLLVAIDLKESTIEENKDLLDILYLLKKDIIEEFDILWGKFIDWDKNYGAMIFPIHNFDCAYNMLIHIYQETATREEAKEILSGKDFLDEFDVLKNKFLRYLRNIDKFYGREEEDRCFYNIFSKCPFFELIEEIKKDESMMKNMGDYIINIIALSIDSKQLEEAPDDQAKAGY